jgi:hypothetical protein
VIAWIADAGWRGELAACDETARRTIYFDQGNVVGAESDAREERLGDVLLRNGDLTEAQVTACRVLTESGRVRFGQAAVELGYLTRDELFSRMRKRVEAIFAAAIATESGTYAFEEGFEDSALSFRQRRPADEMLALSADAKVSHARARLPSSLPGFRKTNAPEHPSDPRGLREADGGLANVADLVAAIGATGPKAGTSIGPRLDPRRIVDVYNEASSTLFAQLDAPAAQIVRTELARFAESAQYAATFAGAGPADDGSLRADVVYENLVTQGELAAADQRLARMLYDYASYAIFVAGPYLEAPERIAEQLVPIAPAKKTMPVPSRTQATVKMARFTMPRPDASRTVKLHRFEPPRAPLPAAGRPSHSRRPLVALAILIVALAIATGVVLGRASASHVRGANATSR